MSAEPASGSSDVPWPWIVVVLVLAAIGLAWWLRSRSAAHAATAAQARDAALHAYAEGTTVHDRASVLLLADEADRPRLLAEVSAAVDRAQTSFASLSADPSLATVARQIQEVQLALTGLHGAIEAQSTSGVLDADVLRRRLAELDDGLRGFREAVVAEPV